MGDEAIRESDLARENAVLLRLFDLLDSKRIPYPVVSGGNTPAAFDSHLYRGLTEIRPGTYVFNDRNTVDAQSALYEDCALTVLATVVSRSVPGAAIVDAGSKTLSADTLLSGERQGFGYIRDRPGMRVHDLSEEHGHLNGSTASSCWGTASRSYPTIYASASIFIRAFLSRRAWRWSIRGVSPVAEEYRRQVPPCTP